LIAQITYPSEIKKIDDGLFRTYEATLRFKWAH